MPDGLSQISNIVVLMLENRSFDNMLGWQCPERIEPPVFEPSREAVAAAALAPLTSFQEALLYAADHLPSRLEAPLYAEALRAGLRPGPEPHPLPISTPAEARPHVRRKLAEFLGREAGEV